MCCDVKVQKPCDRLLSSGVSGTTRSGTLPLSLFFIKNETNRVRESF